MSGLGARKRLAMCKCGPLVANGAARKDSDWRSEHQRSVCSFGVLPGVAAIEAIVPSQPETLSTRHQADAESLKWIR